MGGPARLVPLAVLVACLSQAAGVPAAPSPAVHRVVLDSAINEIQAEYVDRAITRAEREGSALVLLELDTPGGLGESMEAIIRRMLSAEVPICAYVYPPGAARPRPASSSSSRRTWRRWRRGRARARRTDPGDRRDPARGRRAGGGRGAVRRGGRGGRVDGAGRQAGLRLRAARRRR